MPAVLLTAVLAAGPVFAAGKGQEDFDKATELKLSASTISDLGEVIRLTESALEKGLDEATAAFAKKVLASTLIQRAPDDQPVRFAQRRHARTNPPAAPVRAPRSGEGGQIGPKQPEALLMIAELNLQPGGAGVNRVASGAGQGDRTERRQPRAAGQGTGDSR